MSDQQKPILFTETEQLLLQELQLQVEGFNNFAATVQAGTFPGSRSILVANLLQFLQNMITQSSKQIDQVKSEAQARSNAPKEETAQPELKKSKKVS